jgi:hypothetical protein
MRIDICKWDFDVCTDQIKIEERKGSAHNAGTAVYQVVGAVINSETLTIFTYLLALYQLHKLHGVKWKVDYGFELGRM